MQTVMIGNQFMENPRRAAGRYQIAFDVTTPGGKNGVAVFYYEYDKRDVMEETLYASPEVADELIEFVGDDPPSAFGCFGFPSNGEENKNADKVSEASDKASVLVFGKKNRKLAYPSEFAHAMSVIYSQPKPDVGEDF